MWYASPGASMYIRNKKNLINEHESFDQTPQIAFFVIVHFVEVRTGFKMMTDSCQ